MKISVRNLGVLKQAEFELGDLTLICGDNNTGKTYATYALFGFLSNWRRLLSVDIPESTFDELVKDGVARIDVRMLVKQASEIVSTGCDDYVDELAAVFAARSDRFKPAEFQISLNKRALSKAADGAFHGKWKGASEDTLFSFSKERGDFDLVISLLTRNNNIMPRGTIHDVVSRKEGYRTEELLKPQQVRVYLAEPVETDSKGDSGRSHTLVKASINKEYGIEARSFDDTINEMNEIQDSILWGDDE